MTSPPEEITIKCPSCGGSFESWWRPSINLQRDDFDEECLREATIKTCPRCGAEIELGSLIVGRDGAWQVDCCDDQDEDDDGTSPLTIRPCTPARQVETSVILADEAWFAQSGQVKEA